LNSLGLNAHAVTASGRRPRVNRTSAAMRKKAEKAVANTSEKKEKPKHTSMKAPDMANGAPTTRLLVGRANLFVRSWVSEMLRVYVYLDALA